MKSILGLYPLAFWGIVALAVAILVVFYILWRKGKRHTVVLEKVKGKLLCEFCSPEGAYTVLCDVWKGAVKKIEDKSRGTFLISKFVKAKEIPGEHSVDLYWVIQDHCFPYRYPEGRPYEEQTVVMKTHYVVNDQMPKITCNPAWTQDLYYKTSAALGKLALDEKNMQMLVSELGGVWAKAEEFLNYLKRVPLILIGIGVLILIGLVNIFMIRGQASGIDTILKFMNLK